MKQVQVLLVIICFLGSLPAFSEQPRVKDWVLENGKPMFYCKQFVTWSTELPSILCEVGANQCKMFPDPPSYRIERSQVVSDYGEDAVLAAETACRRYLGH